MGRRPRPPAPLPDQARRGLPSSRERRPGAARCPARRRAAMDGPSRAPKLLEAAETAKMDLTTLTHSEPFELRQHLRRKFQSPHGQVRVPSEERRTVLVTVEISRAGPEDGIDRTFELSM